jgi:uncharacterized protein (DUF1697 family)
VKSRRVALLRGINVGKAKRVAMADLRKLFESLGHEEVTTLLNSGNVVFSSKSKSPRDDAAAIERAIATRLKVSARVTVLDGREIRQAVAANPLRSIADNPSRLLLMVLHDGKVSAKLEPLLAERWEPEAFALAGRIAYLWCPDGILAGRLWAAADRLADGGGTARNLATMSKLVALVDAP